MQNPGKTWFISDTHFGHKNILRFDAAQGERWADIKLRDKEMVQLWNDTVGDKDEVFHLGDFAFLSQKRVAVIAEQLRGKKFLMLGNHDNLPVHLYSQFFTVIRQPFNWRNMFLLTHAPIHPMCLAGKARVNVHGHIHKAVVTCGRQHNPDPRYVSCCVEKTGFKPISSEVLVG